MNTQVTIPTLREGEIAPNAQILLCRRYYSKLGDNPICIHCGERHETHDEFLTRIAGPKGTDAREYIEAGKFLPNSPTLFNRGLDNGGTLSACFVLEIQDNMLEEDGIMNIGRDAAAITKFGGGVGYYFGHLRPKGAPVSSTHGKACGPVEVMRYLHAVGRMITQSGKRAAAQMGVLPVEHKDILEFISCKDYNPDDLSTFNISVSVSDDFMMKVHNGDKEANYIMDRIAESAWRTGDPGLLFRDRVNEDIDAHLMNELGPINGTNPCVAADTWIMTEDGPRQVRDLIGKQFTAIVDGKKHLSTKSGFFQTGENRQVVRVVTKEGYNLKVTPEHKLLNSDGKWVQAQDLTAGDKIILNRHDSVSWGEPGRDRRGYVLGALIGDGTFHSDGCAVISTWDTDVGSQGIVGDINKSMFTTSLDWHHYQDRSERRLRSKKLTAIAESFNVYRGNKVITPQIEKASRGFYTEFLRGFFDADGTVGGNKEKGLTVRLSQSNLDNLYAVQRMLLRLGIASKIYKDRRPAGMSFLPDGKNGFAWYPVKANHELVISKVNVERYARWIGFSHTEKHNKLNERMDEYTRGFYNEMWTATVKSVTEQADREDVYDASIEEVHMFDANGLMAHNCSEQHLRHNESCNLASINLMAFLNEDRSINTQDMQKTVAIMVRYLNNILDENSYPTEGISDASLYTRRIGVGFMGLGDLLAACEIDYDSSEARRMAADIMKLIRTQCDRTTQYLAERDGQAPCYEGTSIMKRNSVLTSIQPTGTTSLLLGISTGIEPLFALENTRETADGDVLIERPLSMEILKSAGSSFVPKTAEQISASSHLRMVGTIQEYVDNGISKTINLPNSATVQDVREALYHAWDLDCKAVSIFRDGCRDKQVLTKCGDEVCSIGEMPEELNVQAGEENVPFPEEVNGILTDPNFYNRTQNDTIGYLSIIDENCASCLQNICECHVMANSPGVWQQYWWGEDDDEEPTIEEYTYNDLDEKFWQPICRVHYDGTYSTTDTSTYIIKDSYTAPVPVNVTIPMDLETVHPKYFDGD